MIMPFGKHKGKELDVLPDGYLRWLRQIETNPPATVKPENREQYVKVRLQLKYDANRILRDRARNGVRVETPADEVYRNGVRY